MADKKVLEKLRDIQKTGQETLILYLYKDGTSSVVLGNCVEISCASDEELEREIKRQ